VAGRGVGWLADFGCRHVLVLAVPITGKLAVLWSVACRSSSRTWKAIAGQRCQGDGETAHRQPIGRAVAWSGCRAAGRHRLPACARAGGAVVGGVQLIEPHLEGDRGPVGQGEGNPALPRSGVPFLGQGVGWLAGIGCRRALVLAVLDHRQTGGAAVSGAQLIEPHLEGDRGPVAPGQRRDSTPAADRVSRSLVRVSGGC